MDLEISNAIRNADLQAIAKDKHMVVEAPRSVLELENILLSRNYKDSAGHR
jgi:hypothetical protein